jgi:D-glycero-alpha-D-manno-heptose-7-phosphate kinase
MIVSRTPLRVSFAGGGTDLPEFYRRHGGSVVSVAIAKYVYLAMHPFFHANKIFLKYSSSELVDNVSQIKHPIIRQVFGDFGISGVDFNSSADIPAGTGLGSSSAFTAGLITLCAAHTGKYMSKADTAKYACEIEIDRLGEPIGKQDQYACALGGLNYIRFNEDDTVSVEKVLMRPDAYGKLQSSLLMFFLGEVRPASSTLSEQKRNTESNARSVESLKNMARLADGLRSSLPGDPDSMGEALHAGWMYKRELASGITNAKIDHYYELGIKNGASGGKLLGAGGGGFLLFYVKEDARERVRAALSDLEETRFQFENIGTTIIYYD